MDRQDDVLSLVLFSGTDDKLNSAGVLAVGAAAMGRKVNVFLQYWALDAFRADRVLKDHGVAPEAGEWGTSSCNARGPSTGASSSARRRRSARWAFTPARSRWRCSASRRTTSTPWSTTWRVWPRPSPRPTAR